MISSDTKIKILKPILQRIDDFDRVDKFIANEKNNEDSIGA